MKDMKIMLVDDEERLLHTTKLLFQKMGMTVFTCSNGRDALNVLSREKVHVVFLDIKMPGMDGMQVLREIKKNHPLTEVIILTGHATMECAVEGLKSGAMDFLVKPLSMKKMLFKAEEAFERVGRQESKIRSASGDDLADGGGINHG